MLGFACLGTGASGGQDAGGLWECRGNLGMEGGMGCRGRGGFGRLRVKGWHGEQFGAAALQRYAHVRGGGRGLVEACREVASAWGHVPLDTKLRSQVQAKGRSTARPLGLRLMLLGRCACGGESPRHGTVAMGRSTSCLGAPRWRRVAVHKWCCGSISPKRAGACRSSVMAGRVRGASRPARRCSATAAWRSDVHSGMLPLLIRP